LRSTAGEQNKIRAGYAAILGRRKMNSRRPSAA
jgi:hypothetical protein